MFLENDVRTGPQEEERKAPGKVARGASGMLFVMT